MPPDVPGPDGALFEGVLPGRVVGSVGAVRSIVEPGVALPSVPPRFVALGVEEGSAPPAELGDVDAPPPTLEPLMAPAAPVPEVPAPPDAPLPPAP